MDIRKTATARQNRSRTGSLRCFSMLSHILHHRMIWRPHTAFDRTLRKVHGQIISIPNAVTPAGSVNGYVSSRRKDIPAAFMALDGRRLKRRIVYLKWIVDTISNIP
jgi:hypothetical protein